jgi:hypothetical protein
MTQPTNTFDTYAAKGIREDLEDKIYMVSPEKTPVFSMGRRLKATQKFHEWQRDALDAPNKDNANVEGDDRTGTALTATTRVGNYAQLFDKVAVVTSTTRKSNTAGRSDEMKYQIATKAIPAIKRDLEAMLLSNNAAVAGNSTTARKSSGLGAMIYTNISSGVGGSTPSHTSGAQTTAPTAGTARAFTETLLKAVLASVYTNSGDMPDFVSVTPSHKQAFSGFSGIAVNRYQVPKGQQGVIVGGADIYMGDFGELTIVPNYVQATANNTTALVLNKEQYGVAFLQGIQSTPLAKTGHSDKEMVFAECLAVAAAESALGKVADLTP